MKAFQSAAVVAAMLVLISCASRQGPTQDVSKRVDALFAEWDKPDSPGCALGVIRDGRFIHKCGYGMANLEYGIPITADSVFRIGSTSKQFTAMCLALLEEEGKLSLDDPLRKFLPEMPGYADNITIRHLLHHTSGIRDYLTLWEIAGERDDDFFVDGEVVDLLARQKELNFAPGEEHLYSNSGYFLLSQIVSRAAGMTLRAYAENNIFKPLGMKNTHFHDDHTMIVRNRATGYAPKDGGGFQISMTTLDMVGDGGVFTTVDDLFLWDQNFYHNRLGRGGQALIDKVLTPGVLNSGRKLDYALGLGIGTYRGLRTVSHGGAFVGYRADIIRFPEQRFTVICLANLATFNPTGMCRKVADLFLADEFTEKAVLAEPAANSKKPSLRLSEEDLRKWTGAYHDKERDVLWRLILEQGKLIVRAAAVRFPLSPLSPETFSAEGLPFRVEVEFRKEKPGIPAVLLVRQEGSPQRAFEKIILTRPTAEQLRADCGAYFSEEVGAAYTITLRNGELHLVHANPFKNYPKEALEPTFPDTFQVGELRLNFQRTPAGDVAGFTVDAGRVKNIRFVRREGGR
jgi:CubicO group peptidase (beta-lactamase class C family)